MPSYKKPARREHLTLGQKLMAEAVRMVTEPRSFTATLT